MLTFVSMGTLMELNLGRPGSGEGGDLNKTRRLQRRSLRLPTRSKSAQTGHLCTTAQAGADPGIFVCWSKFPGLKVGRRS